MTPTPSTPAEEYLQGLYDAIALKRIPFEAVHLIRSTFPPDTNPKVLFDFDHVTKTQFKATYKAFFIVPRFVGYQYIVLDNPGAVKDVIITYLSGATETLAKVALAADLLSVNRPSQAMPIVQVEVQHNSDTEITEHFIEALEPDATVVSASVTVSNTANIINSYTTANAVVNPTSGLAVAANLARKHLVLVNDSPREIYLSLGNAAVVGKGIRLNRLGGSYEITDRNLYRGVINAITTPGSPVNLTIEEGV